VYTCVVDGDGEYKINPICRIRAVHRDVVTQGQVVSIV
jgi:hypothetical protein